jgi:choline dehydrogenase-like flavoprotein
LINCQHGEVFDAIVIGTGFAGAVTAARLVQVRQRICVLERGRKFERDDFPMYPKSESLQRTDGGQSDEMQAPDLARWFWAVDQGLYDVRDLDDVVAVQAAGYGGGSLIYANVHLRAPPEVFHQGWPRVYRRKWLDPFYDLAAYMLDVQPMPKRVAKTEQLRRAAVELKREGNWFRVPLAVRFGANDPATAGQTKEKENKWGRKQGQCDMRGQCWLGCRAQAKNTLDLNYLAIVEDARGSDDRLLADIRTLAEVDRIERTICACGARFAVHFQNRLVQTDHGESNRGVCCAKYVFLCAGAVNSTELLLRSGGLLTPEIRRRVGSRYHPNADSIAAVFDCDEPQESDFGPTITSALLYHGPRRSADELWVLEFKTDHAVDLGVASRLVPGVPTPIFCGATELRLVQAPLFDFGSFAEADSRGMLVVAGDGATCRAGGSLSVGPRRCEVFGRMVADARPLEDWFLVEDGGYPTDIEPLLGIMRSPLWLRRNRYLEQPPPAAPQLTAADIDPGPEGRPRAESLRQAVLAAQRAKPNVDPGVAGRPRFPLSTAIAAVRGVPKRSVGITADPLTATGAPFGDLLRAQPLDLDLDKLLPAWLRDALARDRTQLAEALATLIRPFIAALLDDLAHQINERFDFETLAGSFGGSIGTQLGTLPPDIKITLIRGLLRQGIQVLWGNEVALAQRVNDLLLQNLPKDAQGWANLLAPLLGWLLQYREGNGRTAVLLVMGRDQYRGRLAFDDKRARLTASLPSPLGLSPRLAQEGLLRDIAANAWHGELRTNPAWTFLKRRITVHSQGGCPMSSCESARVTDYTGEVIDCPGLYVMDAAAFPTAVGVNPSATIIAVAEYKIARFIKKVLSVTSLWRAPSDAEVKELIAHHGREVLDPIAKVAARSATPTARPLGLTFKEVISGLFSDIRQRPDEQVDWVTLKKFDAKIPRFEEAERGGIARGGLITMELTASIRDLDRFLRVQRQGLAEKVALKGTVKTKSGDHKVQSERSFLQFFLRPCAARDGGGAAARFFRYHITFCPPGGREWVIEAAKVLRDDPRFDVWYDLSTLYFDVFEGDPAVQNWRQRGIMRLAPVDFVEKQLRSVTITPEDADPSRKSWAYFAFAKYYTGEVAGIYLQRRDLAKDFLKNVINAAHGE